MKKILIVKCAYCEKQFNFYDSEFRPFCSEQCKLIDLGQWLNEDYKVPVVNKNTDQAQVMEDDEGNENE